MKYYDIVILFHPNQSDRVPEMVDRYKKLITESGGEVILDQDLERKKIHYTIKQHRSSKAHFVLLCIRCDVATINQLTESFKFNDVIMRTLIVSRTAARTENSPALLEKDERSSGGRQARDLMKSLFKAEDIYLNISFLREHTLNTGRIMPGRVTGMNSKQQRQFTRAVKWARYLGLLCYCDRHA